MVTPQPHDRSRWEMAESGLPAACGACAARPSRFPRGSAGAWTHADHYQAHPAGILGAASVPGRGSAAQNLV